MCCLSCGPWSLWTSSHDCAGNGKTAAAAVVAAPAGLLDGNLGAFGGRGTGGSGGWRHFGSGGGIEVVMSRAEDLVVGFVRFAGFVVRPDDAKTEELEKVYSGYKYIVNGCL